MIKEAINKAVRGLDLNEDEMAGAMGTIMAGDASPAQIGALLVALRMKGECEAEIAGAARAMRAAATPVPCRAAESGEPLVDVVGTGGDGAGTFNVSTAAALVTAGAGARVAKHGNRAASGTCGSADVLQALGVDLELSPEEVGLCIDEVGVGFLFAPALHRAMRFAVGPRRELGLRTVFNLLGPLTNPAGASALVVGVYDAGLVTPMARVLARLGAESAFVVHGEGGLDEITITGVTRMARLKDGAVSEMSLAPEELGLSRARLADVSGGDVDSCRDHLLAVLEGRPGPRRDMTLMNAAAALVAAGAAPDLAAGVAMAARAIDSGAARAKLEALCARRRLCAAAEA